jgi:hypothetical protein
MSKRLRLVREKAVHRDPRCRNPHCENTSFCRGLCRSCYQKAWELVNDRSSGVTWEKLERAGKCEEIKVSAKEWLAQ